MRSLNVYTEGLNLLDLHVGSIKEFLKSRLDMICVVGKSFRQFCEGQIIITGTLLKGQLY